MKLVTAKAASLSLILVCYSLDMTQRTCFNFVCPEVVSQLEYMIVLCPFQRKIIFYSILFFVWTEPHSVSKSCAQWRPLHIYTAPVGSVMPLVALCWVWMWTNVCFSALHWLCCPWLLCLCSGGWQSSVPWTTAQAASEFVLLSRAGKRFSMGPPKGRQNHYSEFSLLLMFFGWGWI